MGEFARGQIVVQNFAVSPILRIPVPVVVTKGKPASTKMTLIPAMDAVRVLSMSATTSVARLGYLAVAASVAVRLISLACRGNVAPLAQRRYVMALVAKVHAT